MGLLGEQKMKDYGSRLVRKVKQFIEKNQLEEYIANRPGKRTRTDDVPATNVTAVVVQSASSAAARTGKPKARKAIIEIDSDDEFGDFGADDIDYANLDIP